MKLAKTASILALALGALLTAPVASADTGSFTVFAQGNSTSGGTGVATFNLLAGQSFSVSVAKDDFWNAGALPRWSNANGLSASFNYSAGMDAEIPVYTPGTQIGSDFGNHSQGGLAAPFGSLVGSIGGGNFFFIGTGYTATAATSGLLTLHYFDSNASDNTGSILAQVTAVPEPETYALLLAGLGLMGAVARRRKQLPI